MNHQNIFKLLFFAFVLTLGGCSGSGDDEEVLEIALEYDGQYNGVVSLSGIYLGVWHMTIEEGQASGYYDDGSSVWIDFSGTVYKGGSLDFEMALNDGTAVEASLVIDQNGNMSGSWTDSDGESGTLSGAAATTTYDGEYSGSASAGGSKIGSWKMTVENGLASGTYTEEGESTSFSGYVSANGKLRFRIPSDEGLIVSVDATIADGEVTGTWSNTDGESGILSGGEGDDGGGGPTGNNEETEATASIALSIPTLSMITDIGVSTNRVYFTDTNEDAVKFVVKNGTVVVKDTFFASSDLSAIARSFSLGEIFDFNETPSDNFGKQVALNVEGFTYNGTLVSKTAYSYFYTFTPTKIEVEIDGVAYGWENFAFQDNHQPEINDLFVVIPDFTILATWDTECGDNDPDEASKASISLIEWHGPFDTEAKFSSSGVPAGDCQGSVTLSGPSGQFGNGNYYTVSFSGDIGFGTETKRISGEITQAVPTDDQQVRKHVGVK